MKILVILLTWNEQKGIPVWIDNVLSSWRDQRHNMKVDVVVFDNCSGKDFDQSMRTYCEQQNKNSSVSGVNYRYITTKVHYSGPICMNLGFMFGRQFGEYDYYVYQADDSAFTGPDDFSKIIQTAIDHPEAGMVSALQNVDNCMRYCEGKYAQLGEPIVIEPFDDYVNLHFTVFSAEFLKSYNYKFMDVINTWEIETVVPFLNIAIGKDWLFCRSCMMDQQQEVKYHKKNWKNKKGSQGFMGFDLWQNFRSRESIFVPGAKVGLGYSVWRRDKSRWPKKNKPYFWTEPDLNCYDEHGNCKDKQSLYDYIVDNLFLPTNVFNYNKALKEAQ